ncbi:MAG: toll/interleukin-1 receptor domain-containing protein [Ferroplasma sp.]
MNLKRKLQIGKMNYDTFENKKSLIENLIDQGKLTDELGNFIMRKFKSFECNVKVFLSYSSKDREIVSIINEGLKNLGLMSFMAHEDIQPSEEWQGRILSELKAHDIFIPVLTKNFFDSEWTNQETGAAVTQSSFIIPISIAFDNEDWETPRGFIGKYQSLKIRIKSQDYRINLENVSAQIQNEICQIMIKKDSFKERLRNCFVNSLVNSNSYAESNAKVDLIKMLEPFNVKQLRIISFGYLLNDQIRNANSLASKIETLMNDNTNILDTKTKSIMSLIEKN